MTGFDKKLWLGLLIMALLTPVGIYLPEKLGAGEAWGEWGADALKKLIGYVPSGLERLTDTWKAPISDYNFGGADASSAIKVISYISSAMIGIGVVAGVVYLIAKLRGRHEK
jgi:cobalt/nickel transport protein